MEKALRVLYAGDWPARLWGLVPRSARVQLLEHEVDAGRQGRPPLRIAFASDLHVGPTTPHRTLENAFAHLRAARPDVLALGGDYVYLGASTLRVNRLNDLVDTVEAALKVAVLGNHDFWARPARLEVALSAAGTVVLVNETLRLPPPHDDVAIVGLDDPYTARDVATRAASERAAHDALDRAEGSAVRVAVCHSPDGLSWVLGKGVRLFLCGHTHGGHIALPGYRPLIMPSPMGRRYPYGRHEVDGTTLFVSRGVGGSLLPFRTWAPPDVAVFTLV